MVARVARISAFAVAAVLSVAGQASAQEGTSPFGETVVTITATQEVSPGVFVSGSQTFGLAANTYGYGEWIQNGTVYNWNMINGPVQITSSTGQLLGTIGSLALAYDVDPSVAANFNVTAGALNTTFNVTSSNLVVAPGLYLGQASAGVTLQDNDGDGATMGISSNPGGLYSAKYNAGAFVFANLLGAYAVAPFDNQAQNQNTGGFAANGFVTDISAEFNFSLSAGDTATGTSIYTVIPAPGSVALLGIGGLLVARRRR